MSVPVAGKRYALSLQSTLTPGNMATVDVDVLKVDGNDVTMRVLTGRAKGVVNTVSLSGPTFRRVFVEKL